MKIFADFYKSFESGKSMVRRMSGCFIADDPADIFSKAARDGNLDFLSNALGNGDKRFADVGAFYAAKEGHVDCLRLLLPFIDDQNDYLKYSLAVAADGGHDDCVETLLETDPDEESKTNAAMLAAKSKRWSTFRKIMLACDTKAFANRIRTKEDHSIDDIRQTMLSICENTILSVRHLKDTPGVKTAETI